MTEEQRRAATQIGESTTEGNLIGALAGCCLLLWLLADNPLGREMLGQKYAAFRRAHFCIV